MAPSKVNKTTLPGFVWACRGSTQLQGIVYSLYISSTVSKKDTRPFLNI